ncbi:uncharacterized protein [Lepisosteus oculatus]|uniref:uncharacterized protein isoform X1 n=1 Tax=Lepisosteus oculatus TaxID=7918 RepID=UPI0035F5237B
MSRLPCSLIMLYLCGLLLSIGVWTSPCQETLTSKDFHTVLSWRCPELPPDVLYTVEIHTRRQGKEPWKNVAGCVNISFSYCNLSSSFADIYQLHFTRLRAVWAGGGSHWTGSHREFFPLRDTSFSSPRLSLSVRGQSVTVKVHLPCSPYRSRRSQCKLVSKVTPRLHISVTVYREDLPSHSQVETLISHGKNPNHVFTGLVAGHRYCAVANLSSIYSHSPLSPPRCFSVPEHVPVPLWVTLTVILSLLQLFLLLAGGLLIHSRSKKTHLPRTLEALKEDMSRVRCAQSMEADEPWDHLSILSLPPQSPHLTQPLHYTSASPTEDHGYHSNSLPTNSVDNETYWDSRTSLGMCCGPGYPSLLPHCTQDFDPGWYSLGSACDTQEDLESQSYSRTDLEAEHPLLPTLSTQVDCQASPAQDIPLTSVRLRVSKGEDWGCEKWDPLSFPRLVPLWADTSQLGGAAHDNQVICDSGKAVQISERSGDKDNNTGATPHMQTCPSAQSCQKALDSPFCALHNQAPVCARTVCSSSGGPGESSGLGDSSGILWADPDCESGIVLGPLGLESLLNFLPNTAVSGTTDTDHQPVEWVE